MFQPLPDTDSPPSMPRFDFISRASGLRPPRRGSGRAPASVLSRWLSGLKRPAVFAHRGASRDAPENSLGALRLAAEQGADGVEFDVQACGTGELVVFHDHTLARCTGALGEIAHTPFDELRKLRLDRLGRPDGLDTFGSSRPSERIPSLDEWLDAAPRSLFLNLEVKAATFATAAHAQACARALQRHHRQESAVVSAFHPAALVHVRRAVPELPRALLLNSSTRWRLISCAGALGLPQALHPEHRLVTPERVRLWHAMGLKVLAWTVDEPEEAERCFEAGVDGLITNVPSIVRPIAERYRA